MLTALPNQDGSSGRGETLTHLRWAPLQARSSRRPPCVLQHRPKSPRTLPTHRPKWSPWGLSVPPFLPAAATVTHRPVQRPARPCRFCPLLCSRSSWQEVRELFPDPGSGTVWPLLASSLSGTLSRSAYPQATQPVAEWAWGAEVDVTGEQSDWGCVKCMQGTLPLRNLSKHNKGQTEPRAFGKCPLTHCKARLEKANFTLPSTIQMGAKPHGAGDRGYLTPRE